MGEYWRPVNVTRRELIDPHRVGCGLKLGEWNFAGSRVWARIRELLDSGQWSQADDIRAASDYGGDRTLLGEPDANAYDGLGDVGNLGPQCVGLSNLYDRARTEYADVSTGPVQSPVPATVAERLTEKDLAGMECHCGLGAQCLLVLAVAEVRRLRGIIAESAAGNLAVMIAEDRAIREEEGR